MVMTFVQVLGNKIFGKLKAIISVNIKELTFLIEFLFPKSNVPNINNENFVVQGLVYERI